VLAVFALAALAALASPVARVELPTLVVLSGFIGPHGGRQMFLLVDLVAGKLLQENLDPVCDVS